MNKLLTVSEVKDQISKAEESFRHEECTTCECYLGYVAQLVIDSEPDAKQYLQEYQPDRDKTRDGLDDPRRDSRPGSKRAQ